MASAYAEVETDRARVRALARVSSARRRRMGVPFDGDAGGLGRPHGPGILSGNTPMTPFVEVLHPRE
ncbi:hypothetical protein GCM10010359_34570 [Streptomyces morookaense]|nr:hypothetical protein GCM10010359_34570 [Streptomyces morookaense]